MYEYIIDSIGVYFKESDTAEEDYKLNRSEAVGLEEDELIVSEDYTLLTIKLDGAEIDSKIFKFIFEADEYIDSYQEEEVA